MNSRVRRNVSVKSPFFFLWLSDRPLLMDVVSECGSVEVSRSFFPSLFFPVLFFFFLLFTFSFLVRRFSRSKWICGDARRAAGKCS